jgi:hypothetical protein
VYVYYYLSSASVNVHLWELGEYQGQETNLPHLIDPGWIKGYLAHTTVLIGQDRLKVWAMVDLAKVHHSKLPNNVYANVYWVYSDSRRITGKYLICFSRTHTVAHIN